jgi:hypothetical protein
VNHAGEHGATAEERQADTLFYSLNNECTHDLGFTRKPFKTVKFVLSENSRGVQAADLMTGAIAYETNRRHLEPRRFRAPPLLVGQHAGSVWPGFVRPADQILSDISTCETDLAA